MYMYVYVCMYIYIYIYICIQAGTQTREHKQANKCLDKLTMSRHVVHGQKYTISEQTMSD